MKTSSFGELLKGKYNLYQTEDEAMRPIKVVNVDDMTVVGDVVPANYAALFYLVMPLAQYYQEQLGYPDPIPEEVSELLKRVAKKLGLTLSNVVEETINEVMSPEGYEEEPSWDYNEGMPQLMNDVLSDVSVHTEDKPFPQENANGNDTEEEETCSPGDDDLS